MASGEAERTESENVRNDRRLYKILKLLIIIIGLLVIGMVLLLTRAENHHKAQTNPTSAVGEAAPTASGSPLKSSEKSLVHETETAVDPFGQKSYVIFDSYYQKTEGYSWQDLYTTLITLLETTPAGEGDAPVFCMIDADYLEAPFFISGLLRADGSKSLTIGLYAKERYYELIEVNESILYDAENGAFFCPDSGMVYRYAPHVMLGFSSSDLSMDAFDFRELPYMKASAENAVTVEQIEDLVTYPGGEGE